jgi:hypothetical protein
MTAAEQGAAPEHVETLHIPFDYVRDLPPNTLNRPDRWYDVPVIVKPDLETLGRFETQYAGVAIYLREPNDQVLLHEILHLICGAAGVTEASPHGHTLVNRLEVALWALGWRRS